MLAGSLFHLPDTFAVKVVFLRSGLDLGTSSFHGSAAVRVTAPARIVALADIFSPTGCFFHG